MLKLWAESRLLRRGGADVRSLAMYNRAVEGMHRHLVARFEDVNTGSRFAFLYERDAETGRRKNVMEHLACFVPGLLALGHELAQNITAGARAGAGAGRSGEFGRGGSNDDGGGGGDGDGDSEEGGTGGLHAEEVVLLRRSALDLEVAEQLAEGCWRAYRSQPTGLGPEMFAFDRETGEVQAMDPRYVNRFYSSSSCVIVEWFYAHSILHGHPPTPSYDQPTR